ncbi:hypothetical protein ACFSCX_23380 [Bacillus salitolerans]|uniref:Uncharacterized protein n=1 Tax=Bacillus salitolerans TaxID=1437434 RepID=A0ABW4LW96_9BACI
MGSLMAFVGVYLMPILCIIFIVKGVELAKQIKRDNENTANLTAWVAISFTLIVYSFVWLGID